MFAFFFDLIPMLNRYIRDYDLAARPYAPLFPDINPDGSLGVGYMSMTSFNMRLRRLLSLAGVTEKLSARSLRIGRRSDLRNSNTPPDVVCQIGRHKSEPTSFGYHRTDPRVTCQIPSNNA